MWFRDSGTEKKKKSQEAELEAAERRLRGFGHLCPKGKEGDLQLAAYTVGVD